VGKIQSAPVRIVEFCQGKLELAGLGKISLRRSKTQIAGRIAAVTLKEPPVEVKEKLLPRSKVDGGRGIDEFLIVCLRSRVEQGLG
jgi:hypothetical protein